jgi:N-acetylneuraminic acid mutarotase
VAPAGFSLSSPVERAVAVLAGDTIFVVGGLNSIGQSVNGVFTLNPATGDLSAVGTMPQAFHDAAGAVIGSRLFVFGGGRGESSDTVQVFDLQSHRSRVSGRLPKPLSDLSSAVVGSTVYLIGGYDGANPQATIYSTSDGARFPSAGRLPLGLRYAAVASIGGKIVVAGGVSTAGPVSSVYVFDPATGLVALVGRLPVPVGHATAFALAGRIFVAGGRDARGRAVRQVVAIDLSSRAIALLSPLAAGVSDAAIASDGRRAWLIGGWRGQALAQVLTVRLAAS